MKKRVFFCLKTLITLIMLGLSTIFITTLYNLEVVPDKYMVLLLGIFISLNLISAVCLYVKKWWLKIIAIPCYLFIVAISLVGNYYGTKTNDFLNEAFDNYTIETTTYHVMTRAKNGAKTLEALEGKGIVYFTFYNDVEKIQDEVSKKIINPKFLPHDDMYDTFINFLVGQYSAIILSDGVLDILSEDYKNLDNRLNTLYTFEVESKVIKNNTKDNQDDNTDENHSKINKGNSVNIFLSGSDSRSTKIYNKSRSDVNMIVTVNPDTKTVLLTSIPRDYYVQVHGQTGLKDKLTHAGIYGLDRSVSTVEDLFDIDIDYSVKVGFPSVVTLVDLVGGVDIDSDLEFDSSHMPGWRVKKGLNHMDGAKALAYARERYAYAGGDRHRILNQQQVLEATMKKIISDKSILLKYDELLNSLSALYITDIPREEISKIVKMQLNDMSPWNFKTQSVDGIGELTHTYTAPKSNRYVIIPNKSTVNKARSQIKIVMEAK